MQVQLKLSEYEKWALDQVGEKFKLSRKQMVEDAVRNYLEDRGYSLGRGV
jgi:predicted transcriptional regulator